MVNEQLGAAGFLVIGMLCMSLGNAGTEFAFKKYGKRYNENMFYMHALGLPLLLLNNQRGGGGGVGPCSSASRLLLLRRRSLWQARREPQRASAHGPTRRERSAGGKAAGFAVGLLRAAKDMRGNAIAFQLALPAALMMGACGIWLFGWGIKAALIIFSVSLGVGLLTAIWHAFKHYRMLFEAKQIMPKYDLVTQLKYALPQGLAAMVFRLNIWMDILMLGYFTDVATVGLYHPAMRTAGLLQALIVSFISIFAPLMSQLHNEDDFIEMSHLYKLVSRWLITFAIPISLVFII